MRRFPLLAPLLKMRIIMADNLPKETEKVIYSKLTRNHPGRTAPQCKFSPIVSLSGHADLLYASRAT